MEGRGGGEAIGAPNHFFMVSLTCLFLQTQACEPAARLALIDVNSKEDLLPGYHLNLHWNDSGVRFHKLQVTIYWNDSGESFHKFKNSRSLGHVPRHKVPQTCVITLYIELPEIGR
jgi:hypothetical protein